LIELESPYELREGQGELVDYLRGGIEEGEACLAHAPTGIGKTLAALLAALPRLPEEGKILYVVNRKNQIPIILKELRNINERNGTEFRATAFASKSDLCRDTKISKLGYRELLEACELRRRNGACPYYNALFKNQRSSSFLDLEEDGGGRRESEVASILKSKILLEMPPPHMIEGLAEEVESELGVHPVCVYELLKLAARESDVLVGTFWYSFHPVVASNLLRTLSIDRRNCILICDEAHNLPKFCREALSHGMSVGRIRYAIRELRRYSRVTEEIGISPKGVEEFLRDFASLYSSFRFTPDGKHLPIGLVKLSLKKRGVSAFKGPIESLESAGAKVLEIKMKSGQPPRSHLAVAGNFIGSFLLEQDRSFERFCVLGRTRSGRPSKRLEIRCLDPAPLSSSVLDPGLPTGAMSSILMSGTLVPGDYYRDILGIPDARHREFPNVFPKENRALLLDDKISLAWKSRKRSMYQSICERMKILRDRTPNGVMFFFPSYEVMNSVADIYSDDNLLIEERASTRREDAERVLESGGTVMGVMGASLSEGLDLPGLIGAIAVFGLPLEKISDLVKIGMKYYESKFPGRGRDYFYYLPAVTKIVQSAGRAHRSKSDKAMLCVFDRRFCRNYLDSAPTWWSGEGVTIRDTSHLTRLVSAFWSGQGLSE